MFYSILGRLSLLLIIFIGCSSICYAYPDIIQDSDISSIKVELDKAHKIFGKNINESLQISSKLLLAPNVVKNDSILNFVKYRHSFYLLIAGKNKESLKIIEEILTYYKLRDLKKWVALNTRKGALLIRVGKYNEAENYLRETIPVCDSLNMMLNKGLALIYLGDISLIRSDLVSSFQYAEKALEIFQDLGRKDWEGSALTDLAYVCIKAKDYESAQNYFDQIDKISPEITNESFLVRPNIFKGLLHFELGNIQKSLVLLENGIKKIEKIGTFPDLPLIYQYLAKICIEKGKFKEADAHLNTAISLAQQDNNKKILFQTKLIEIKLKRTLYPDFQYYQSAFDIFNWANQNDQNDLLLKSSLLISEYYEQNDNLKKAIAYRDIHNNALEREIKDQNSKEIALLKGRAEITEKAKESKLREEYLVNEVAANKKIRNILLSGIAVISLMLGFSLYLFIRNKKTNKLVRKNYQDLLVAQDELADTNDQLKSYIESNIQLEQFAHIASHDLRSPIVTINSFAKLLEQRTKNKLEKEEHQFLEFIKSNSEQMLDLVNDLLDYSKVNSQDLVKTNLETLDLITDLKNMFLPELNKKEISFNHPNDSMLIHVDKIKLKRVFQNLISNSIRYSDPNKESYIEIKWGERGAHFYFDVKDNGIGMDKHKVNIFKPYVRLNKKTDYKGSGLGLSICKKIINKHGGEITYNSTKGEGSIFSFTIEKSIVQT